MVLVKERDLIWQSQKELFLLDEESQVFMGCGPEFS